MVKQYLINNHLIIFSNQYSQLHLQQIINKQKIFKLKQDQFEQIKSGISTDEILPSHAGFYYQNQTLGQHALSGLPHIEKNYIQNNHIDAIIVGRKFGGGSSREHAVKALIGAGIKLVIVLGGNTERIFKENCFNNGHILIWEIDNQLTTINQILQKIHNQQSITIPSMFEDPLRQSILQYGGLQPFTKLRLSKKITLPSLKTKQKSIHQTSAEKIISLHARTIGDNNKKYFAGDIIFAKTDLRFSYEMHTKLIQETLNNFENAKLKNKSSIILFEDHSPYLKHTQFKDLRQFQRKFAQQNKIKLYKQIDQLPGSIGICHSLINQQVLSLPGQLIAGTDSHTCSAGVVGSLAIGIGATAMACAYCTNDILIQIPKTIRVQLKGKLPQGCESKDVILKLLANPYIKKGGAVNKILQYQGKTLNDWSVDELFVLTNMAVECGAMSGLITQPIDSIINHIKKNQSLSVKKIKQLYEQIQPDQKASYDKTIKLNLDNLKPMVAQPHHPTNGIEINNLPKTAITKVFIGSCTGGSYSDIQKAIQIFKQNPQIKVPVTIQPSTMQTFNKLEKSGDLDFLKKIGVQILYPACGACCGMGPGGVEKSDDIVLSTTNRNFYGRMGKKGGKIYLSGAKTAAYSALKGYIINLEN